MENRCFAVSGMTFASRLSPSFPHHERGPEPMARSVSADEGARPRSLLNGAIVVSALYFGRDILLPFGLSILLSFLLAPFVDRLERWGRRRITAVLSTVTVAFLSIAVLAFVLVHQAYSFAY